MPMFHFFRVFLQDRSDCDNDLDAWVSFDSEDVTADFGPRDPSSIFQGQDQELIARSELKDIAIHKLFRAVVHKNEDIRRLRTLFSLQHQELIVATDIELYSFDVSQGKDTAILLSSMAFNSRITGHSVDSSRNYNFRFQIVGRVGLDNAPDMSAPPWIAEKETQIGLSPAPAKKGPRLVAKGSTARDEVIDRYFGGSFSTRHWRKVSSLRMRFWGEAGLAALSGVLGMLTLYTCDWIEELTGFDPDDHNGSFEWAIVATLFLICILSSIAARSDWRRLTAAKLAGV